MNPPNQDRDTSEAVGTGPSIGDFEDFTEMALTRDQLDELVSEQGECVFNWSTTQGYPIGVVMAYIFRNGSFWLNCTEQRKRVAALRARPQASVVVSRDGRMATYKGDAVVHSSIDDDWSQTRQWFYAALSGSDRNPDNPVLNRMREFLDGPHQVVIELPARLVVSFDFSRFMAQTQSAIQSSWDRE